MLRLLPLLSPSKVKPITGKQLELEEDAFSFGHVTSSFITDEIIVGVEQLSEGPGPFP